MAMFKAFKPEAMNKIAGAMGYTGNMDSFQQYIEQDPARKARMDGFVKAAQTMAKGGVVKKMNQGGNVEPPVTDAPTENKTIGETTIQRMYQPGVPVGGTTTAAATRRYLHCCICTARASKCNASKHCCTSR